MVTQISKAIALFIFLLYALALKAQYRTELVVARDGSGDFTSIQAAIDETKSFPERTITIHIRNGVYREKVRIPPWNPHLRLIGESMEGTVVSWDDHFQQIHRGRNSTFFTATLAVEAVDVYLENLTIQNTSGKVGQAIALAAFADRCQVVNCRILGNQDALFADGPYSRQLYRNCLISGTTDFIFGQATAVFEECTIHSFANSFITAASTAKGKSFGLVFLRCQLTAAPGVDAVYLGRPWRPYAKTTFIDCTMGSHIVPAGWDNWNDPENEGTAFYAEYGNTGPGARIIKRVPWSHQLTKRQAGKYHLTRIFKSTTLPPVDWN